MILLNECPICKTSVFAPFLQCEDYTVSHETFQLVACQQCEFVFTNPQPDATALPKYYRSEAYISHSNKSRTLVDYVYKVSRTFTLKWKSDLIRKYSAAPPRTLLDFGCGTGAFLRACLDRGIDASGIEPSDTARNIAKTTGAVVEENLNSLHGQFDAITLWHVLEHIGPLHETLATLCARLQPNGTMFIAVPNLKSPDAAAYGRHWAAYDVPRHLWHFSQKPMQQLLGQYHLKLLHVLPMKLDAYYVSLLSERYKTARSHIPAALLQGWRSNRAASKTGEYSSLIYVVRK